jgi:hypothetical protein
MAVYKLFPTKDSTIYSRYPSQNTGLDSIIETSTDKNAKLSRYLIQFSQEEIESLLDTTISSSYGPSGSFGNIKVDLKTYIATIENLNTDTTVEVFPLSTTWNMGTGHYNDIPKTDNGCSWVYRSYSGSNAWQTSGWGTNITGSYGDVEGGGTWYYNSALGLDIAPTQVYNYTSNKDLNVNVTGIIKTWYSQSKSLTSDGFDNNGFIIKQSKNDEVGGLYKQAVLKYYSIDTNTIYPPELQFKWEDYSFATASSSIPIINNSELVASLDNNPGEFRRDSIHKFKINCRPRFPARTYQTSSVYLNQHYLPISSSYAVKDLDTNEFVIDFDSNYTRISADATGSYFDLYMKGLEPERYYQILLKVPINNQVLILDDNYYFKIING